MLNQLIVGLARASTDEERQGKGLSDQVARLEGYGCSVVLQQFESGRFASAQDAYGRLWEQLRAGSVAEIVATRLDRITRDEDELKRLHRYCQHKGIKITLLDQPLPGGEAGELTLSQLAWLAQWESKAIGARISRSYSRRREKEQVASGRSPYGYLIKAGEYVPDNQPVLCTLDGKEWGRFQLLRRLLEILLQHHGLDRSLRLWLEEFGYKANHRIDSKEWPITKINLHNLLSHPVLRGAIRYNLNRKEYLPPDYKRFRWVQNPESEWVILENRHQAIISALELEQIQQSLAENRGRWQRESPQHEKLPSLGAITRCGNCGATMQRISCNTGGVTYCYLKCYSKANRKSCNAPNVSEQALENALVHWLTVHAASAVDSAVGPVSDDGGQGQERAIAEEIQRWEEFYQTTKDPLIARRIREKKAQLEEIRANRQELKLQQETKLLLLHAFSNPKFWEQLSPQDRRTAILDVIAKVTMQGKQIGDVILR